MALICGYLLLASAAATSTTAVSTPRTGPELSDVALFLVAALAIWLTRRALRNRGRRG